MNSDYKKYKQLHKKLIKGGVKCKTLNLKKCCEEKYCMPRGNSCINNKSNRHSKKCEQLNISEHKPRSKSRRKPVKHKPRSNSRSKSRRKPVKHKPRSKSRSKSRRKPVKHKPRSNSRSKSRRKPVKHKPRSNSRSKSRRKPRSNSRRKPVKQKRTTSILAANGDSCGPSPKVKYSRDENTPEGVKWNEWMDCFKEYSKSLAEQKETKKKTNHGHVISKYDSGALTDDEKFDAKWWND